MASRPTRRLGLERLEDRALMSTGLQPVVVMSENLYMGADPVPALASLMLGGPLVAIPAATQLWKDVQSTNFSERADAIAAQIIANKADLVGLQEVMLYRTGVADSLFGNPTKASAVELDFLQVLLGKLAAKGVPYSAVQVATLGDVETAGFVQGALKDIRLTDRVAILARSNLVGSQIQISNPQGGGFAVDVVLPLPGGGSLPLERGWNSIDVAWSGAKFRFINMCLETPVTEFPLAPPYRTLLV